MTVSSGVIDVQLRELGQLFNSFDPAPFHERDLDDSAEEFIASWARDLPRRSEIRIVLHLPDAEGRVAKEADVGRAIGHYFGERADMAERERREEVRLGRRYLWIGLPVLAACLALSQIADNMIEAEGLARLTEESLILLGWVACWKAIETLLYDWQPMKRRRDLYRRLARAEVRIESRPA